MDRKTKIITAAVMATTLALGGAAVVLGMERAGGRTAPEEQNNLERLAAIRAASGGSDSVGVAALVVRAPDRKPDGDHWDALGGLPDLRVEVRQGATVLGRLERQDAISLEATYCELFNVDLRGGPLTVTVTDADVVEDDPVGQALLDLGAGHWRGALGAAGSVGVTLDAPVDRSRCAQADAGAPSGRLPRTDREGLAMCACGLADGRVLAQLWEHAYLCSASLGVTRHFDGLEFVACERTGGDVEAATLELGAMKERVTRLVDCTCQRAGHRGAARYDWPEWRTDEPSRLDCRHEARGAGSSIVWLEASSHAYRQCLEEHRP